MGASLTVINQAYNSYRDRYYHLLSRGARSKYPDELDHVRLLLNSVEKTWQKLADTAPERLYDVVVHVGLEVKPILDKIESAFPVGTVVGPGYTERTLLKQESTFSVGTVDETTKQLLERAPEGIGPGKADELDEGIPWYFIGGIDLRIIGGVAVGLGLVTWLVRRRNR